MLDQLLATRVPKHPAKRFTKAITRSVASSNNAPASELIFSAIESGHHEP